MSRILIFIGFILILIGLAWPLLKKLGLGHLPGDILIKREGFTFYFPITTCLVVSVIIYFILWLLNRFH